jgi:DNA-binding transcriptional LysR family regulator
VLVNDSALLRGLARQGLGLIYAASLTVAAELAEGSLEPVLEPFAPAQDSIFIYYPRASRDQPKLRAFIEACAQRIRAGAG